MREIRPQPGPQHEFLSCEADVAIYGGAAGGGKSFALLLDVLRHCHVKGFAAVLFRRESTDIMGPGGLWEEAAGLYPLTGAKGREDKATWKWPSGAGVGFKHLQHEKDKYGHQGKQYAWIGFDELTHFSSSQYWYLFSRLRTTCGVKTRVRATTNPDADSWVRQLIDWWIGHDGYPIEERSGVLRWFVRVDDALHWADSPDELRERFPESRPKSLTFIAAKLSDNKILNDADPEYRANLRSLNRVERERLELGNWDIRPAAGLYFRRGYFGSIDQAPPGRVLARVRAWDQAATAPSEANPDPDYTVGVRLALGRMGEVWVEHVERFRGSPRQVEEAIENCARSDPKGTTVGLWEDPGAAGKAHADYMVRKLAGVHVRVIKASRNKVEYAGPISSQAEQGNVVLCDGPWHDTFLAELEAFPDGPHDDQVDALSLAYLLLADSPLIKGGRSVGSTFRRGGGSSRRMF